MVRVSLLAIVLLTATARAQDEFDGHFGEWAASIDADQAMHILQSYGVPAAKVMNEFIT